jgi:hypothetical protein
MEILRVPSREAVFTKKLSEPFYDYDYSVTDLSEDSIDSGTVTSDDSGNITIQLSNKYDSSYIINVDEQEFFVDVVRPYVDPTTKGQAASEIEEYAKNEQLARAIIDSIVKGGFYFSKEIVTAVGLGADYLPIWKRSQKLLRLHENNILVFDIDRDDAYGETYELSKDKFAIQNKFVDGFNRNEAAALQLPGFPSDSLDVVYAHRGFPRGYDYTALLEVGYKNIPDSIVRAAELLIEDIACGKLDYYKKYVADYNTDQFKIKFDSRIFDGTGNAVVDKILSRYVDSIRTLGVL